MKTKNTLSLLAALVALASPVVTAPAAQSGPSPGCGNAADPDGGTTKPCQPTTCPQELYAEKGACQGANHFNPYGGDAQRTVQDLAVWGGVGQHIHYRRWVVTYHDIRCSVPCGSIYY